MEDTNSDAHVASSTTTSSSSASILSEKVQRALQIRTDTPAMKAALASLGQLSSSSTSHQDHKESDEDDGILSSDFALDARSVRHAIEYDALQQALMLRQELSSLCESLHALRQGISQTATIAHTVKKAIHTQVVVASSDASHATSSKSMLTSSAIEGLDHSGSSSAALGAFDEKDDEERLAANLAEAFTKRNLAQERLTAVHQFLETFDLSEQDSNLLDHYNFEDLDFTRMMMEGSHPPVNGSAFLNALERVKEIRQALSKTFGSSNASSATLHAENAGEIVAGGKGSSLGASSALRMMEHLAQKQEQAYERLYQWLQSHLQLFPAANSQFSTMHKKISFAVEDEDEDPDSMDRALQHPFVQTALYTLRHVPAFYRHILELIASRRRQEETRIFLLALTSGYNGLPPMERLAHDPVAYVGDQLAFAFRSLSTEADVANTIVHYRKESSGDDSQDEPNDNNTETQDDTDATQTADNMDATESSYEYAEKPISASDMLSTSLSGMARPLRTRIVGVITQLASRVDGESDGESDDGMLDDFDEEGALVRNKLISLYEICGLVLFYISAMEKTVRKLEKADAKRGLLSNEDRDEAGVRIGPSDNALLVNMTACLVEGVKAFEATVRVYSAMMGTLSVSTGESVAMLAKALLVRIAETRQSSPGYALDVPCLEKECETTLSTAWITRQVVEAALPFCTTLDDTVALKNAIGSVKEAGIDIVAVEKLDELIEQAEISLVDRLIEGETAKVLEACGLSKLLSAWDQWKVSRESDETALMISQPGLAAEEVEAATKEFYTSLYSPPFPSLETEVMDRAMRKTALEKIAAQVCTMYKELYEDITDSEKGGYEDLSFLGHTPSQVSTLFSP